MEPQLRWLILKSVSNLELLIFTHPLVLELLAFSNNQHIMEFIV